MDFAIVASRRRGVARFPRKQIPKGPVATIDLPPDGLLTGIEEITLSDEIAEVSS